MKQPPRLGPNMENEDFVPTTGLNRFNQKLSKNEIDTLRQSIPAFNKPDANQKKMQLEAFANEQKVVAKKLVNSMIEAVMDDHKAI